MLSVVARPIGCLFQSIRLSSACRWAGARQVTWCECGIDARKAAVPNTRPVDP